MTSLSSSGFDPRSSLLLTLYSLLRWTLLLPLNALWVNDSYAWYLKSWPLPGALEPGIQLPIQQVALGHLKGSSRVTSKTSLVVFSLVVFHPFTQARILALTTFVLPLIQSVTGLLILSPKYLLSPEILSIFTTTTTPKVKDTIISCWNYHNSPPTIYSPHCSWVIFSEQKSDHDETMLKPLNDFPLLSQWKSKSLTWSYSPV